MSLFLVVYLTLDKELFIGNAVHLCLYNWDKVPTSSACHWFFLKIFAFAIEKWHGGKFSPKQSFSYRYTYKYIQLKYLWNDQCCLPGPRTVCHLASNHTFCHCVTWFLESVLFHTNIVVVMSVIRPGGHAVRSSRMFSILAFIILPEHFYTRSLWLYNFIFFLCHPSLTFLQSTRSTAGMALARQWNSCTPHLSIK